MNARAIAIATGIALTAGCGLVDPDITNFDLSLPERTFTVDASQWMLDGSAQMPSVPCGADPAICADTADSLCAQNSSPDSCAGVCERAACALVVSVSRRAGVDLFTERPELKTIEDQPLIEVTIDRVQYEITENTFTIDTPVIEIYAAPQSVMSAESADARLIGTIESIPAGMRQDRRDLVFAPGGREALRDFISDFKTPFNILVASRVQVQPGDSLPEGRIEARLNVTAHAGL